MVKSQTDTQTNNDEFTKIFNEYRAKIEEITKKTAEKNLQLFNEDANNTADNNGGESKAITPKGRQESINISAELERRVNKEASQIINEAKRNAQKLLNEAEERIKREANKKTQSEVDKIIGKARKEAEDIMAQARHEAKRERSEIIATSKQEAEQLIKDITETCREDTQAQSSQVVTEAREKGAKMITDIITSSAEISKMVMEILSKANDTMHQFENELQTEFRELAEAIAEAQNRLEQVTTKAFEREETRVAPSDKDEEINENTVLSVQFKGEQSDGDNGNKPLFSGQVELKSISSFDYRHLRELVNYLIHVPSIKYVQEYASEKEMSIVFDVQQPLPFLDILSGIPSVDKVTAEADGISLILKNRN